MAESTLIRLKQELNVGGGRMRDGCKTLLVSVLKRVVGQESRKSEALSLVKVILLLRPSQSL